MAEDTIPQLWDTIAIQHVDPELGDAAHVWEEMPENMRGAVRQLVESFTEPGMVTGAAHDQVFVWQSVSDGDWRWHRVAANNEVLSDGEGYSSKSHGVEGAHRANPELPDANFHVEESTSA